MDAVVLTNGLVAVPMYGAGNGGMMISIQGGGGAEITLLTVREFEEFAERARRMAVSARAEMRIARGVKRLGQL